jgi:hypothetical protein
METMFSMRLMMEPHKYEQNTLINAFYPCGGEVELLHRDPASRRRRRKGKSQIWDSKIWSRDQRDSDQEGLRWRGPVAYTNDKPVPCQRGRSKETELQLSKSNKYLAVCPRWVLYSRIDWPTNCRS